MAELRMYTFEFYPTGNPPEWWSYEYFSDDLSDGVKQPLINERSCMECVLIEEGFLDEGTCSMMTEYDLERLLLENKIYVKFIGGDSDE